MPTIRLFNVQRSGSNYLEFLLTQNFHVSILGRKNSEKHCKWEDVEIKEPTLHIIRNPCAWVASFHRFRKHFTWYDPSKTFKELLESYAMIWNDMNWNWILNCEESIRYEDLIQNPQQVCERIAKKFGLIAKDNSWIDCNRHFNVNAVPDSRGFDKNAQLNMDYLRYFDKESLSVFINSLDSTLLDLFEYAFQDEREELQNESSNQRHEESNQNTVGHSSLPA